MRTVRNRDISRIFTQIADLLEIRGANQFRVRSYRNAAEAVASLPRQASELLEEEEDFTAIRGIGEDLAEKIREILTTGESALLNDLKQELPESLTELTRLPELGPARVRAIHEELGVATVADLEQAIEEGRLSGVEGIGEKISKTLADELDRRQREGTRERFRLDAAAPEADELAAYLRKEEGVVRLTVAGSLRRGCETVGDLDIVVSCDDPDAIMDRFTAYGRTAKVVERGETRSTIILHTGLQADLRVVPPESHGAALLYFTGSKDHGIRLRRRAGTEGLKINEYGIFRDKQKLAGEDETDIYEVLGLPWIAPELREDRGEFEAAEEGGLPRLIEKSDIRGDLQMHSHWSDGTATIRAMAEAAQAMGYDYIAISDHSKRVTMANGLDEKRLASQLDEIEELNKELEGFRILKSCEVDILTDGNLDLSDELLERLEVVIASVHYDRDLPHRRQTERIIAALRHGAVDILAHPTGRLIGERPPIDFDFDAVVDAAVDAGTALEINSDPRRLDLAPRNIRAATRKGARFVIDTDAHTTASLANISFGVAQARRGWLEADAVLNTKPAADLLRSLHRR